MSLDSLYTAAYTEGAKKALNACLTPLLGRLDTLKQKADIAGGVENLDRDDRVIYLTCLELLNEIQKEARK